MTGDIVFVAGDVGGPGGMERQSEELVRHLLESGRGVTVIARTCTLPAHKRLEFVRVGTPARPFSLAYPAFVLVASALATRRGSRLLHTTGAVVLNRADVSTVHYCHHAARRRLAGNRASRQSVAYRLNSLVVDVMSRAAEAWCFRPSQVRILCAVSHGTAAELAREFPPMQGSIRTIANGVDTERFRPDPALRERIRAKLKIPETQLLAVFAGGDWERKGLPIAVAALQHAPDWQLAVAGVGDNERMRVLAESAGVGSRLRLLGRVSEMQELYAAADAFVFPTSYEAFPLVALEAAACGLPLLVSRVNGVEELLEDGVNGWFITPDALEIGRRLSQLAADRELAAVMAGAATASAQPYTWGAMAEGYLSLYADIWSRRDRPA